jgi:hypothetical protein
MICPAHCGVYASGPTVWQHLPPEREKNRKYALKPDSIRFETSIIKHLFYGTAVGPARIL